eukprot:jgi/Hompol1/2536/HPOL_002946-RA
MASWLPGTSQLTDSFGSLASKLQNLAESALSNDGLDSDARPQEQHTGGMQLPAELGIMQGDMTLEQFAEQNERLRNEAEMPTSTDVQKTVAAVPGSTDIADLQDRLQAVEAARDQAIQQLSMTQVKLQETLDKHTLELVDHQKQYQTACSNITHLEQQLSDAHSELKRAIASHQTELAEIVTKHTQESENQSSTIEELRGQLAMSETKRSDLEHRLAAIQSKPSDIVLATVEPGKQVPAAADADGWENNDSWGTDSTQHLDQTSPHTPQPHDTDRIRAQLAAVTAERDRIRAKLDLIEDLDTDKSVKVQLQDVRNQLDTAILAKTAAMAELEALTHQLSNMHSQFDQQTQIHADAEAALRSQIADLNNTIATISSQAKTREDELLSQVARIKSLAAEKIKRLMAEQQRTAPLDRTSDPNGAGRRSTDSTGSLQSVDVIAVAPASDAKRDVDQPKILELEAQIATLGSQLESAQKALADLEDTNKQLSQTLAERDVECEQQKQRCHDLAQALAHAESSYQAQLERSLDDLAKTREDQQTSTQELVVASQKIRSLQLEVDTSTAHIKSQDARIQLLEKEMSMLQQLSEDQNLGLTTELESVQNKLRASQDELATANATILDLQQRAADAKSTVEKQALQILDLQGRIRVLDEAASATAHTQNDYVPDWNLVVHLVKSIQEKTDQLRELGDRIASEKQVFQQSICNYQEQIVEVSAKMDQLQLALVQQQTLAQQLTEENEQLNAERAALMEKLTSMKNDENKHLRAELAEAREYRNMLEIQVATMSQTVQEMQSETSLSTNDATRMHAQLTESRDHAERLQIELDRLRQFLMELEETRTQDSMAMEATLEEYRRQLNVLSSEREQWEQATEQARESMRKAEQSAAEMKDEVGALTHQTELLKAKLEQDQVSIINLQHVLEQFEASKGEEISRAVEVVNQRLLAAKESLEAFQSRALQAESELEILKNRTQLGEGMEQDLQEKNVLIGKLRHD